MTTTITVRSRTSYGRAHHWAVLVVFSALSIAGNALHSLNAHHGTLPPALSAAIATIAPLTLLASTHSLVVHMQHFAGWTRVVAMFLTLVIAIASFVLSFAALRELASMAGVPNSLSWLMAIIIDVMVVQATFALVMASRQADQQDATKAHNDSAQLAALVSDDNVTPEAATTAPNGPRTEREPEPAQAPSVAAANSIAPTTPPPPPIAERETQPAGLAVVDETARRQRTQDTSLADLAQRVHDETNATVSPAAIADALSLRLAGKSLRDIAERVGVGSHSTIRTWVKAAAAADVRFADDADVAGLVSSLSSATAV